MHCFRTSLIHIPDHWESFIWPIDLPQNKEFGSNFIFKDDNARPHRTKRYSD